MTVCYTAFGAFPLNVSLKWQHQETNTWRECHTGIASSTGLLLGGFLFMSLFLVFSLSFAFPLLYIYSIAVFPEMEFTEFQSTCYYSFRPISTNEPHSVHRLPSIYRQQNLSCVSLSGGTIYVWWRECERVRERESEQDSIAPSM